ncbi:MAG: hypothetical protein R3223_03115 [Longimicrobiales bacterium]|nr:hypothetical protein [Longimicrobiales bacterium]
MPPDLTSLDRVRRRSVGFIERDGESWACFLVTFRGEGRRWHGYFSFRPRDGGVEQDEIRTADIFIEDSEEEIDRKARGLGRPLLAGLLASAIHTAEQSGDASPRLRQWFREVLSRNSRELLEEWESAGDEEGDRGRGPEPGATETELARMRSLYESYRLDQVVHFICLVRPSHFRDAVDRILDGRPFDFGARDRLQFAMMVVEHIEQRLPLPPFEVWAEDYLENREEYLLYAHTLHREGRLP